MKRKVCKWKCVTNNHACIESINGLIKNLNIYIGSDFCDIRFLTLELIIIVWKIHWIEKQEFREKKWNTIFCFLDVCHHYQLMKFVKHKWNPLTQMIKMIMTLHFGQSINKRNEESNYNPNMDQGLNVNSRVTTITSNNSNENIYSGNKWKKFW